MNYLIETKPSWFTRFFFYLVRYPTSYIEAQCSYKTASLADKGNSPYYQSRGAHNFKHVLLYSRVPNNRGDGNKRGGGGGGGWNFFENYNWGGGLE